MIKIHSVMSIAQLKSNLVEKNFYYRSTSNKLLSINNENDDNTKQSYIIKSLLNKSIS